MVAKMCPYFKESVSIALCIEGFSVKVLDLFKVPI